MASLDQDNSCIKLQIRMFHPIFNQSLKMKFKIVSRFSEAEWQVQLLLDGSNHEIFDDHKTIYKINF